MSKIWVSDRADGPSGTQFMVTAHPGDESVHIALRDDPGARWGPPIECKPDKYSRKDRQDTTDTTHASDSIAERVARASDIIRGDSLPNDWTLEQWLTGLMVKLGEAAFHAGNVREGINKVFPGSAMDSLEQYVYCLEAVSAVAQHAIEDAERGE